MAVASQQEALSKAYVQAVSARAGFTTSKPELDIDSVDLTVHGAGEMRPRIDLQLKATINLNKVDDDFQYPLKIKNYNDLRIQTQTPRLLVVLQMPADQEQWLHTSVNELILRRCAYWVSLKGAPDTTNKESITVSIPDQQLFNVDQLNWLMDRSRTGAI